VEVGVLVRDPGEEAADVRVGADAETLSPNRPSSALEKVLCRVRWQIGWIGTVSRPPRLFGIG
jgi:hypothetical protein